MGHIQPLSRREVLGFSALGLAPREQVQPPASLPRTWVLHPARGLLVPLSCGSPRRAPSRSF